MHVEHKIMFLQREIVAITAIIKPDLYTTAKPYSDYNNDSLRVHSIESC